MKKRNIVLYFSLVVILISLAFAVSYAYLTAKVTGNDAAKATNVTSGTLDISFATSAYINNSKLPLIKDTDAATKAEQSVFTISNTNGNVAGKYQLDLTEVSISDNLKSFDFKWELTKNNAVLNSGNFTSAVTGTDFSITPSNQNIAVGATDSYVLRIWLSETDQDQLALTNGTFSAKVKMTATVA